ncbi:YkgJ family cysteine cluster protein [candidate division KSB1 bacterium]|nr:YkgJ family cysteine cluster protein [candidate division KSB1 bacterium]
MIELTRAKNAREAHHRFILNLISTGILSTVLKNRSRIKTKSEKKTANLPDIPTDNSSIWLHKTRRAQHSGEGADVPCGSCTACCTSSYFIHIQPDGQETLASIPKKLLFRAPGLPQGNVLMGYDKNGHCPMFKDNKCSIYKTRPQTCRDYDCRVFPATGLSVGADKPLIDQQALRWKFDLSTPLAQKELAAVHATAQFIREHADCFPNEFIPTNATQQAVLAIKVYTVFLDLPDASDNNDTDKLNRTLADAMLETYTKFKCQDVA